MSTQSTTTYSEIDLERGTVVITTTELALEKRGGLVAATDGRVHELTVRVTVGRDGWLNVNVSGAGEWGRPLDFGFTNRHPKTGKPAWSYNNRPHQLVVDAMKMVRAAQAAARRAAETAAAATEEAAAVSAAEAILKAPVAAPATEQTISVRQPMALSDVPANRRQCERPLHTGADRAIVASVMVADGQDLLFRAGRQLVQRYVCASCLSELRTTDQLRSITPVELDR